MAELPQRNFVARAKPPKNFIGSCGVMRLVFRLLLLLLLSMIRFVLVQNRQGKTRLSKWYVPYNAAQKNKVEREIHRAVVSRDKR